MSLTTAVEVDLSAAGVSHVEADMIRDRVALLERYIGRRRMSPRLSLRRGHIRGSQPWVADAVATAESRTVSAHATGRDPVEAVDRVVERLILQLRRVVDADENGLPRADVNVLSRAFQELKLVPPHRPEADLKPPSERNIVRRRTYADLPLPTLSAIADMLDADLEFLLFVHARTSEDVVVHWRDDGALGLLFPPGSVLADENDIVVPEPSRYDAPLRLLAAREEMDIVNHRFLYFVDAADGRGKVLYLRHDGDYGLVEPA
ncbi:MAG: HPF/RaiA family ribosome-associated protein [Solirubrobacterales bacterium]|nr:HPF/RaiA family ribosome-associated protein [Solirubrobacterales bacterium]